MLHMFRGERLRKQSPALDCIEFDRAGRYCYESGGGQQTTQTQQQSSPWAPIQPYLTDVAQQAQTLSQQQAGNNQLPNTYAGISPQTSTALSDAFSRGQNGSPLINQADSSLSGLMQPQNAPGTGTLAALSGGYSDPGSATAATFANPNNINPFLNSEFQAAAAPVSDAVNSQFEQAGRYGSGANQQELTRNLGQLASSIYAPGYEDAANRALTASGQLSAGAANQASVRGNAATGLNSQFNTGNATTLDAANSAPNLANQDWTNLQAMLSSGQGFDANNQAQVQNALAQYQYSQQQPWNVLNAYSGDVTGLGALGGQSSGTSTQTLPQQSMIPSLLGAGLAIGAAPMTGGGSLFGSMFSDRRLKENIKRIGRADNGLPLYAFNYKGRAQMHIGLMADDVEAKKPSAVITMPSGFKMVDYDQALAA